MIPAMNDHVALRAFEESDLGFLDQLSTAPDALGPFAWKGFRDVRARRRRWERDGYIGASSSAVAVVVGDAVAGIASWRPRDRGVAAGECYEIGVALLPEHRGRGVGTAAHRRLVDHLFDFTTVHRLEALTAAENVAERTALERIGFVHEGVLRGAAFLNGTWHDVVLYGLLRDDRRPAG
jgi:ribosomal-protein-alanine N-acetyltransferase